MHRVRRPVFWNRCETAEIARLVPANTYNPVFAATLGRDIARHSRRNTFAPRQIVNPEKHSRFQRSRQADSATQRINQQCVAVL